MRTFLLAVAVCLLSYNSPATAQTYGASAQILDATFPLPTLSTVPQLHTDMPLDCFIGYVAMDSLVRTATIDQLLGAPSSLSLQDLRFVCRLIYGMEEYSHAHLKAHIVSTVDTTRSIHDPRPYWANTYTPVIHTVAFDRWREFDPQIRTIFLTHYIARVRVLNVAVGMDSSYGNNPLDIRERVGITCEVLEKIKGVKLPNNCPTAPTSTQKAENNTVLSGTTSCIALSFQKNNIDFVPQIGEEYYVFFMQYGIKNEEYLSVISSNFAGYAPDLFRGSPGLFRITDGKVEDPRKFWSDKPLTVDQFRTLLQGKIAEIKSWTPAP